ncbi:DMT family transporter [Actinopolymorpha sp. B11F2]|uniref:DMT family transporter n=1 Tax=Actinopolymorpha sp. B11F2 TaxID=3160862 RepID=UPI0032E52619
MSPTHPSVSDREGSERPLAADHQATPSSQHVRVGACAAASAAVLFGSAFVATAFQLRSFTPTSAAMWRGGVGALLLAALLLVQRTRRRRATRPEHREPVARWGRRCRVLVLGVLSGPVFIVGMNIAVAGVGSTITGFVVALYSILSAAIAPLLLREPLRARAVAGLVSALVGTGLLAQLSLADTSVSGMTAGLGAAVSYACYLVLGRRWLSPFGIRPEQTALSAAVLTVVVVLAWLATFERSMIMPTHWRVDAVVALVWLGFVMVAGQTLVMASVRRVRAETSASLLLLNPVTAALLGVTVLGEKLATGQVLGGLLVLVGMALASGLFAVLRPKRRPTHPLAGNNDPPRRVRSL